MAENETIVIKKIKKGGHGHHGGAWKLAYADFVTAMMAFFLLMWLLGTTEPSVRQGIADYFADPWKPSLAGGANTGDATSLIKGGGEDVTQSEGQVKLTNEGKQQTIAEASDVDTDEEAERLDINHLKKLKEKIDNLIETNPVMNQFKSQLKIDFTSEGLRIQIIDQEKKAMFNTASARMEPYAAQIIDQLAPVINELPNRISVSGHTDSVPFPGKGQGYTNWELSADRANAARKELVRGGLRDDKIIRVVGLASSVNLNKDDPLNPMNRRISIIVMNRKTEEGIVNSANLDDFSQNLLTNKDAPQPKPEPETSQPATSEPAKH
jgi:chemotaxis protein MotB